MPTPAEITSFWDAARAAVPALPADPPAPDRVWGFGATAAHADGLLALVLAGTKTGTAGYLWEYEQTGETVTRVGDLDVILDGSGTPRAVIETTAVEVVPFREVTAEHAFAEGEGDRTLASWRDIHRRFYENYVDVDRPFDETMPIVCERFRVVFRAG
ncbi:ASCH domain-containing protein [Microbacterium excoecariae]|uniref:ASCH domain-containing protein n=1 Tax=Microbacterium excoecariae TaxID=2715210 RepID=UPI00140B9487|nr:ASCH domain-containing protein [Microbacterium excoecariae]NHI15954.1 ASCH domain-containing protein [Microbacterium excoecariae]